VRSELFDEKSRSYTMSDSRKLAHLHEQLGNERFATLLNSGNTGRVRVFCDELMSDDETTISLMTLLERQLGEDLFGALVDPENCENVRELTRKVRRKYTATVDYKKSVVQLLEEGRFTDKSREGISEECGHFMEPDDIWKKGVAAVNLEFFHLRKRATLQMARDAFRLKGLRPATIREHVTLAITHPDVVGYFTSVSFGTMWKRKHGGFESVPYMRTEHHDEKRVLNLGSNDLAWHASTRFLGVRE